MSPRPSHLPPVRFRPHHFLCALGYDGHGYAPDFTANMTAIVMGQLRRHGGGRTMIEVTGTADDICAPCPHRRSAGCDQQARIDKLDAAHAAALDLSPGDRLSWDEAQARIVDRIKPGDLTRVCDGCQWLRYGMCEAALARLHGAATTAPLTPDARPVKEQP
ncbi:hypothetical protein ACMU_12580 [Actibacterium mucosum KCTC 23349]|uniref:DUF1284 domain-containing protein n=1 Tax=Actibacterium mucosum KCTC 23349 TaxID=1454373 RepID=A0A037ZHB2_9RHOB|nr:DUF1284 domain-containing protein [Actibacterium mucosum]KAJ55523.1 hypothetical protein ACMU_12580 [Actibacterium mucosum KCTC 23349]